MDFKEKFILEWNAIFPGAKLPNLSFFNSKQSFEQEFVLTQKRVSELKLILQKEEFILSTFHKLKDDKNFQNMGQSLTPAEELVPPGQLLSISDQLYSPRYDMADEKADVFTSTFSSFRPPSKSHSNISLEATTSTLPNDEHTRIHTKSLSLDDSELKIKPRRRSTDPETLLANPPKPAPRLLTRNSGIRRVSLDSGLTNTKRAVKDCGELKTMSNIDLSLSAKLLPSQDNEEVVEESSNILKDSSVSDNKTEEYEHIYTDITDLSINKPPLAKPDVESEYVEHELLENQEQLYENANMKPKIELLVDNSEPQETVLSARQEKLGRERKRLGSQDRQAFLFSDDLDVTSATNEANKDVNKNGLDMEAILNSSHESLVDDLEDEVIETPDIIINNHQVEEDYDDDEHIYANVDDFSIRGKDSDNDSDHEPLSGLPSPNYREMTSDEIAFLQKHNSDDDHSHDESDSDELSSSVPSKVLSRTRPNSSSELLRTSSQDIKKVRNASSPAKSLHDGSEGEEKELIKASRMRKYLVMNLLDSEKCYYDCLEILIKFMKPLRVSTESSQPIISAADFKLIFHRADELFTIHKDFIIALEPRIANWTDGQVIGDLFLMIMHGFDLYSTYIGNYKHAMETIAKCRNANQQFAAIMDQDIRIASLKDPLKLDGLLYKPVDRMTQYSLILNDLMKYTSPDHPDHPLIVEVSGALFDLFEQVNVDTSKKKRRQRQLLKETFAVEIVDGERRARSLILFNDVIIAAKLKSMRDSYVCKWYAALADIHLKPVPESESSQIVPVSAKSECDKLRASIANLRQEIRKEHMPLQQTVSTDASPPFMKRRNMPGPRSSSRGVEKFKKKIAEQERLLQLISPSIPFNLYHKSGKTYTLLVNVESERQAWMEALRPRLRRIHARHAESIQLSSLELQQAFETVLKLQSLGARFGAQLPSPFLGPTRPISVDFSKFEADEKESLTGYLFINILHGKGFSKNSDTYVVLEIDSYGHFFKKSKTKPARGSDPQWDETFEFEIEACNTLRLSCYNKLRLMGDDISGKVCINLTRENLVDGKNRSLNVSLDRGQASMNISLSFSTSMDGIKKCPSFRENGVFGVPILAVCKREKNSIPVVVISCIKEIEKRGMDEVGIYRLSGIASEIQNLKKLFNERTQNAVLALSDTDIHAVAGLLKLYFRELPQSLFTSKLYHKFVEGLSITDAEEKELYMCDVVQELPKVNRMTALYLFGHLRRVALQESQNKMGLNNLATVFGPTVLRPPSSSSVDKENERSSCNVGTFDIGALDVMSQVGIFRYFLTLKDNPRTKLPEDDLELWRRLDPEKALKLEEKLMVGAEEYLI